MPTMVEEAAEAVCGGLFHNEFQFMGETEGLPTDTGVTTWWTRGDYPQDVRVSVIRGVDQIRVHVEWRNVSRPPRVVKGAVTIIVSTDLSKHTRAKIEEAAGNAVYRCLAIFLDVIRGTGIAGPLVKM